MVALAQRVHEEKLSVRKTEELVREHASNDADVSDPSPARRPETPAAFDEASKVIRDAIALPVRVKPFRRGGKVEIRFSEHEELEALVSRLTSHEKG